MLHNITNGWPGMNHRPIIISVNVDMAGVALGRTDNLSSGYRNIGQTARTSFIEQGPNLRLRLW